MEAPRPGPLETQRLVDAAREAIREGDYRRAKGRLLACLKLEPNYPACHKALGSTYAMLRNGKTAAFHYKLFLRLAPNDPAADTVQRLVEEYDAQQRQLRPVSGR